MRVCKMAWMAFIGLALSSFVLGDWMALAALGWFALWETYGILTPRPGDTYSERNWAFTRDKPARLGLTLGLVAFYALTLVRLAWHQVYGEGAVYDALHFASALGFIAPATTWLCIHFIMLGKEG